MNLHTITGTIGQVKFHANPNNQLVTIEKFPSELKLIGFGTDAVVVQHPDLPDKVFKIFADDRLHKIDQEFKVYQTLGNSPYFARCYGRGKNYLLLSYEQGPTLYECLREGIEIPEQAILDVEKGREEARQKGLNPRDIHLKNVILQQGHAKLLDVSEYLKPGNDKRWDYLKEGYYEYYPLIRGRKIPAWIMESVKMIYNQNQSSFSVRELGRKFVKLLGNSQSKR
ncbi:serine/threonine protein kinase [Thermoactinomyces mirandus]|uniref:Serine/threonine protein kinase n=1 Tax=Thermoactinomyces mirandus TaxID=2756294 RepID=A0A7W1XQN0_9BACL|nr:serine/threonine protein kinase [Thermoactinomyces mirandus]MBA4601488.1 serine/threonine protein kinase [Thermoactinomyces mirandus]